MPFRVSIGDSAYQFEIQEVGRQKFLVRDAHGEHLVEAFLSSFSRFTVLIDHRAYDIALSPGRDSQAISVNGRSFPLRIDRPTSPDRARPQGKPKGPTDLRANMPGKVVKLLVNPGDQVLKNQPLLVLEAMKMENEVCSPFAGSIAQLHVNSGQSVENGQRLITVLAE